MKRKNQCVRVDPHIFILQEKVCCQCDTRGGDSVFESGYSLYQRGKNSGTAGALMLGFQSLAQHTLPDAVR